MRPAIARLLKTIQALGLRSRSKLNFRFPEIREVLYGTTQDNYGINPPLPHLGVRGTYRARFVPKNVHFIWIGSEIPRKYVENINRFSSVNPDYDVVLWVDQPQSGLTSVDVRLLDVTKLSNARYYERLNNIAAKADLLRLEIVKSHGGIYSDVDVIAIKPLDSLFELPFLCYEPHTYRDIGNSMFGFPKNDEILSACVGSFPNHIEWLVKKRHDLLQFF
jgi:mannosyltransferase OCH1-like enzyme